MKNWLTFVLFLLLLAPANAFADWKNLAPGLDYQSWASPVAHAFRIDLDHYRLDLLTGRDFQGPHTAQEFRQASKALLTVNGGFFDESFRPLGLIQRRGKTEQSLRDTGWGVFQITGGDFPAASIKHRKDFRSSGVDLALQVGPRLVVDGKIQKFQENGPHRRSAVGVTSEGRVILAVSETAIDLAVWAKLLQPECVQALNLDGGGSTQLSVRTQKLSLDVLGFTSVANALGVFAK